MRTLILFLAMLFVIANTAFGQKDKPIIGIVYSSPHPAINQIIDGFKKTVSKEYPEAQFIEKHANGRPEEYGTQVLATINSNPDLIVPITTTISILTVEQVREKIPVVFLGVTDPVGAGIVKSLEKPVLSTGSSDLPPFESIIKLARKLFPDAKKLGLPYNPQDQPAVFGRKKIKEIASFYGFEVVDQQITSPSELSVQVQALAQRSDIILISSDNLMMENPTLIVNAALNSGTPTIACDKVSVEKGAIAGIGVDYRQVGIEGGKNAIQVLKGRNPGSIPVAVLNAGNMVLNKKAFCEAGLKFPIEANSMPDQIINSDYKCRSLSTPNMLIILVIAIVLILAIPLAVKALKK
jgi:putative ABC transport system substrate-binding protein